MKENDEIMKKLNTVLDKKVKLGFLPTPLHKLNNLTHLLKTNIYIKRDDMTGLALGGNKTRKLEYLMAEALEIKSDVIITIGSVQSNHCRQTAAACAIHNIECYLILIGKEENKMTGNILLDNLLGAKLLFYENEDEGYNQINNLTNKFKSSGRTPYYIPPGGSNPIGINGYLNAYKEIVEIDEKRLNLTFDYIFFASSSYGTHAGLLLGNYLFSRNKKKIYGVSICKSFLDSKSTNTPEEKICKLIEEYNDKYNLNVKIIPEEIIYDQRFNESGYAIMSEDDKKAISIFAKLEAIILDPVYTARAAIGMIKIIESKEISENSNVLFLHTGGAPAIFTDLYNQNI